MSYHKLLERQLKKITDTELLQHPQFTQLLIAVNDSYNSFEKDKDLMNRAFTLSEMEYQEINNRLSEEVKLRRVTINKLKSAIQEIQIASDNIKSNVSEDDNLLSIIDYLQEQIVKRKQAELELLAAKDEAERANLSKSEFLSVMSHEIRTPLHAVIGMGHLLMNDNPRVDQLGHLKILNTASENLLLLINDILDFSKIEAGKILLEHNGFNIRELIIDIQSANKLRAQEQRNQLLLKLDEKTPLFLNGDSVRIGQVLNNLVSNAIKFTTNGTIEIEVMVKQILNGRATIMIAVTDTGVGIAKENQDKIFQHFTQESSSITRQFGGTGLGLTITKRLLQLMDSDIFLTSELGKGSTFYFTLDLEINNDASVKQKHQPSLEYDLSGIKVLLVEDTPFNILYAQKLLERWHAEVTLAENGLIGLEKAQNGHYDVILMDLQMPEMDGFTASQKIRSFNQQTPILALTAEATNNVKERSLACGMNDFIAKPFNPQQFYVCIKRNILA